MGFMTKVSSQKWVFGHLGGRQRPRDPNTKIPAVLGARSGRCPAGEPQLVADPRGELRERGAALSTEATQILIPAS
jgi:hypothetical protein